MDITSLIMNNQLHAFLKLNIECHCGPRISADMISTRWQARFFILKK